MSDPVCRRFLASQSISEKAEVTRPCTPGSRDQFMNFRIETTLFNKRASSGVLLAMSCLVLASCGMFGKKEEKEPLYYSAVETPPLQIPEGMSRPTSPTALTIAIPYAPLPSNEIPTNPPRVTSQSTGEKAAFTIRWGTEGGYLLLDDTQASVMRRLGFVIKRSGMSSSELSSDNGYMVEYWHSTKNPDEGFFSKMAFWRDDPPNYSGSYQVLTSADGDKTKVYVKNADGSEPDQNATEHLLNIIGERLG